MWSPSSRSVTPSDLKYAFSSKHRMYSGSGLYLFLMSSVAIWNVETNLNLSIPAQQDSQEFLRFFLDTLHSALNTASKVSPLQLDDSMSDSTKADLMWDWYSKTENSIVKDLFVGQLRSTLKCTVCNHTSVTFDPFWDLR